MEPDDLERAIDIALDGVPRAEQLTAMIETLRQRRQGLQKELERTTEPAAKRELQERIAEVERQIATLNEQRAISHFVEMSVRVSALRSIETEASEEVEEGEE